VEKLKQRFAAGKIIIISKKRWVAGAWSIDSPAKKWILATL